MKVFLAGKVDAKGGQWRDVLLGTDWTKEGHAPRWALYPFRGIQNICWDGEDDGVLPWPVTPNIVLGRHAYVGPYRQILPTNVPDKYSGYFHGVEAYGSHGSMVDTGGMAIIALHCRRALFNADMVFAYLNSPDCYGTIADVAFAAASGKYIYLAIDDAAYFEWTDYAYVETFATRVSYRHENSIRWDGLVDPAEPVAHFVERCFHDACLDYIAWTEQHRAHPSPAAVLSERTRVATGLRQIQQWSADPRVRKAAQQLLEDL